MWKLADGAGARAVSVEHAAEHHMRYRGDIDGLRAIAVLSVVLYHLDNRFVPGGYVGVDIFFVISGYLITTIVHRDTVARNFNLWQFYERRVRRIFPALIVVCVACLVAGALLFVPDDLRDLGASFVAASLFSSNILFWLQADYFAGPVEFKPLLHTWSLAVEEQFYLFMPPVLWALQRMKPAWVKPIFIGIAAASFIASCAWVVIDPSGNYYLPHTRAWELLVGSLLALGVVPPIHNKRLAEAASICGLALLAAPLVLLNHESVFPAWNALWPCIGAGLMIHSGAHVRTVGRRILELRGMVWIGLISYSLYLVHWPLIVFAKYLLLRPLELAESVALGLVMLPLAWLMWRFVEQPTRRSRTSRRTVLVAGAAAMAIMGLVGGGLFVAKGLPQRMEGQYQLASRDDAQDDPTVCFMKDDWSEWSADECVVQAGQPGGGATLLWGDSHANQYAPVLSDLPSGPSRLLLYSSAGCPPILDQDFKGRPDCRANNLNALDVIRANQIDRVVLVASWEQVFKKNGMKPTVLAATVQRLEAMGVTVAVIGDNPEFPFSNPAALAVRLSRRSKPEEPYYAQVENSIGYNESLKQAAGSTEFFDPMARMCRMNRCLIYRDGMVTMRDNGHLSMFGTQLLINDLTPLLD